MNVERYLVTVDDAGDPLDQINNVQSERRDALEDRIDVAAPHTNQLYYLQIALLSVIFNLRIAYQNRIELRSALTSGIIIVIIHEAMSTRLKHFFLADWWGQCPMSESNRLFILW